MSDKKQIHIAGHPELTPDVLLKLQQKYPNIEIIIGNELDKVDCLNKLKSMDDNLFKKSRSIGISQPEPFVINDYMAPYFDLEPSKPLSHGFYADIRSEAKVGRNDTCTCNSGKKYKHCCINK